MKKPSLFSHLRDILILPFSVTVVVPYFIFDSTQTFIPENFIPKVLGVFFFLAGITLFLSTVFLFNSIGKGTLAPWQPTQKLIITRPYRYCRNPMISGVLFILISESLIFHSENILIWAGAFFLINTIYFILIEEPSLLRRFGDDYKAYKTTVPRWIPRLKPYSEKK